MRPLPFASSLSSTPRWLCWLLTATAFVLSGVWPSMAHADLCVPQAFGVPGRPGPPEWLTGANVDPKIDDPRWVGATAQSYPLSGSGTEANVRALYSANTIYLSWQIFLDPVGLAVGQQDWVYVALAQNTGAAARLIRIRPKPGADGEALGAGEFDIEFYTATTATGAWTTSLPVAGLVNDVAIWRQVVGTSTNWSVNLKLSLGAAAFSVTSPFVMWTGANVQLSTTVPTFANYALPVGALGPGITTPPGAIIAGDYGNVTAPGGSCSTGVSLAWNQIGIDDGTATPSQQISTTTGNTFVAWPTYNGVSTAAGKIKARFRLANWGSSSEWTTIAGAEAVPSEASGQINWACVQSGSPLCPTPPAGHNHQCMLVELDSDQAVTFLNKSVYRNMDFVTNSYFERDAEISIRGLQALAGSAGRRDVYLFVKTRNMPSKTEGELDQRRLGAALEAAKNANFPAPPVPGQDNGQQPPIGVKGEKLPKKALPGVKPPKGAKDKVPAKDQPTPPARAEGDERPITSSMSAAEIMGSVWPTYEVHVFYDTGRKHDVGGTKLIELQPGIPFGYYVNHHGALQGFIHDLVATGSAAGANLTQIEPGMYKLSVPDNGAVSITTRIEGLEPGKEPILPKLQAGEKECPTCTKCPPPVEHHGHCHCETVGMPSAHSAFWGALLVALGFTAWSRRRRNVV